MVAGVRRDRERSGSPPWFTVTAPLGAIEPLAPAVAVIVYVLIAKLAAIVWLAVTLVNV